MKTSGASIRCLSPCSRINRTDFISVDKLSNFLTLTKGFGDGTFRAVGIVVAGTDPTGLAFIDVNHDGFKDLVVSNSISQDVTVNLGDGLGGIMRAAS